MGRDRLLAGRTGGPSDSDGVFEEAVIFEDAAVAY